MRRERLADMDKRSQKHKGRWKKKVLSVLMATVMVAGAGYSNTLPGLFAEEAAICGKEEHVHTDACYTEQKTLICETEEFPAHVHTETCYTEIETQICTQEESTGHSHGDGCYE